MVRHSEERKDSQGRERTVKGEKGPDAVIMREFSRQEGQPVGREKDSCGERKDSQGRERTVKGEKGPDTL